MSRQQIDVVEICEDCGSADTLWSVSEKAHLCVVCLAKRWAEKDMPAPRDDEVDDEFGYFRRMRRLWPRRS